MKLTEIARKTLEVHFAGKEFYLDKETREKYREKKACFVTLTIDDELRGCIGSLNATKELWREVQENALNAAFNDFRFFPLSENELRKIKIEVSVLSNTKKLEFKDEEDLLKKIKKDMGVILKQGICSATFLPQVWEQIPDKREFLEHLSAKAGLNKDAWKQKKTEISYYKVNIEKEK